MRRGLARVVMRDAAVGNSMSDSAAGYILEKLVTTRLPLVVEDGQTEVGSYFVATYPPFSVWSAAAVERDAKPALNAPPAPGVPLGLYLHIPFCRKRCHFCYFRVYTDKNA